MVYERGISHIPQFHAVFYDSESKAIILPNIMLSGARQGLEPFNEHGVASERRALEMNYANII